MSTDTATPTRIATTQLDPAPVNVRVKISGLWTTMLFVFAYVDLFGFFRPDFRADIEAGVVNGFTVNQTFLLATTAYVLPAALMIVGALVLRPQVNRVTNIAMSIIYAVTILGGAIGEWSYYVLGSAIEVALLAAIAYCAWTWPKLTR
jgi:hypothetical protein